MKRYLRSLAGIAPVRWGVLLLLFLIHLISRVVSVLRAAALFRGPNIPVCHWSVSVKYPERINCGVGVVIGTKSTLGAGGGITLGDRVRISEQVIIETGGLDFSKPAPYLHTARPIVIGADVWLGARSTILQGVIIGEGSIIGAGVVIARDVPAGMVVVGQPPQARPPRHRIAQAGLDIPPPASQ